MTEARMVSLIADADPDLISCSTKLLLDWAGALFRYTDGICFED